MVDVALNGDSVCAIASDGTITCWPSNSLGPMKSLEMGAPMQVSQVPPAAALAPGDHTTCAATRAGKVWCWSASLSVSEPPPFEVPDLADVANVVIVGKDACALKDGEVWCWTGRDWWSANSSIGTFEEQPVRVPGF